MGNKQPVTIHRGDYAPPAFLVDQVDLAFDLDPQQTRVTSTVTYRRNPVGSGRFELHGDGLELISAALDGVPLATDRYEATPDGFSMATVPDVFTLQLVNLTRPEANTSLSGLYVSGGNFFTQCEAQGFRAITYFPDRPDVMARYRVTLRADRMRFPVLLSNGNLVSTGDCAPGPDGAQRHEAVWEDPFPKPSYLFALVAGRFEAREQTLRTLSGRDALLQVWVEPGDLDKTGHAMQSLVKSIRWDEERFGLELDLDRFMIVAVGDFNMGAMENKGLNIFNTKYVFATPRIATDTDFSNVEAVVGHEYFHNWTGNRVTCRDWFQLTLKEGLTVFRDQEFSADMRAAECDSPAAAESARAVRRIEAVRVLRAMQFPEDAGPMAHPIRPDAYQEINNFYTVTVYEKGAEVIRMLQTLVGREGFRKGMDLYFARHDGQAVTCDDFVSAIADANGRDLSRFGRWYAQAGTPRIAVTGRFDAAARTYTLEVSQHLPRPLTNDGPQALHVPLAVGLVGSDGRDLPLRLEPDTGEHAPTTRVLELTEATQNFVFHHVEAAPVPSLARDFSAPVIVDFPYTDGQLAFLAAHDADPFNRWEAAQRLATRAILALNAGEEPASVCAPVIAVFARTLDDAALDAAFTDLVLTLPGESVLAEQLAIVDPQRLREARNTLRRVLARELGARWRAAWARLADDGPYAHAPMAAGRRALKNTALGYWALTEDPEAHAAAAQQLAHADNMTDRQAALLALCATAAPQREAALAAFADEFADEPLVMDKWFMLQATMHRQPGEPAVLARVRRLMDHPAFSIRNPNKVRSLIGSFCSGNLAEFHAADGSGHAYWAEQVMALDALNPQVAARLARALDRWRHFTPDHQPTMRAALERVAAHPGLSRDVAEIVGRALAEASTPSH
jgi:aminopeptidase N